ncbi:MAG TPA: Maf family nucleotide pyrophosphatase [Rhodocyclaceae bacterium]|nr:Maf family nucleotide pyrophosphatase [Rhodocyclaceae bacterium]
MTRTIILASTSPYRRELLTRLQLQFSAMAPNTDETAHPKETPSATARRLSVAKAQAVAMQTAQCHPGALIIGSDQVAALGEEHFNKPITRDNARRQLQRMRGKEVIFHTGLCLLNTHSGALHSAVIPTYVGFRPLSDMEIESYLDKEDALNCAGSAKSEALGISLLSYLRGDDPNALIGLPLIALCDMLRAEGVAIP